MAKGQGLSSYVPWSGDLMCVVGAVWPRQAAMTVTHGVFIEIQDGVRSNYSFTLHLEKIKVYLMVIFVSDKY